jgi:3-hydroxybutyryl-CoA dehydratase
LAGCGNRRAASLNAAAFTSGDRPEFEIVTFIASVDRQKSIFSGNVNLAPLTEAVIEMNKPTFQILYFEDLSVGMRETISKTVQNEDVIGFAELSGDHNPIHLSEHFARKTRFGGRIVHGFYTASLISAVIGMRLPGPGSVYISQSLNFLGPVKIGDIVEVSVEVVELTEKGRRVRLQCECRVGDEVVLEGQGVLSVPPAPKPRPATA